MLGAYLHRGRSVAAIGLTIVIVASAHPSWGAPTPTGAENTPIPIYDVEAQCKEARWNRLYCIPEVQRNYDNAKTFWWLLPESVRADCIASDPQNPLRYVAIGSCASKYVTDNPGILEEIRSKNAPGFKY